MTVLLSAQHRTASFSNSKTASAGPSCLAKSSSILAAASRYLLSAIILKTAFRIALSFGLLVLRSMPAPAHATLEHDVGLVLRLPRADQRNAAGQCRDNAVVPGIGDHDADVREHLGMRNEGGRADVGRLRD